MADRSRAPKSVRYESELFQDGFVMLPNRVLFMEGLSAQAVRLWAALAHYARESEECWPGQDRLARQLGISTRSLRTILRELEDADLVRTVQRGLNRPNLYRLIVPDSDRKKTSDPDRKKTSDEVDAVELDAEENKSAKKADASSPSPREGAVKEEWLLARAEELGVAHLPHLLADAVEESEGRRPEVDQRRDLKQAIRCVEVEGFAPPDMEAVIRELPNLDWYIEDMGKFRQVFPQLAHAVGVAA